MAVFYLGSTMQFLAVLKGRSDRFTEADFAAHRSQERAQARTLYAQGFIRQIWHRGDGGGACIVFEADSEEHVNALLNTLPFVKAGMLDVMIVPLKPYSGFFQLESPSPQP